MPEPSQRLYPRLLGDKFHTLPSVLQQFHSAEGPQVAEGTFQIRRGSNVLTRLIASILRLPREADDVPLRLEVRPHQAGEMWTRTFGNQRLATEQWTEDGQLVDKMGVFEIVQTLTPQPTGYHHRSHTLRFFGMALPAIFCPIVESVATADDTGWHVWVEMGLPWVGRIIYYEGDVKLA